MTENGRETVDHRGKKTVFGGNDLKPEQKDQQETFEGVQEESQKSVFETKDAADVGGADVFASMIANVDPPHFPDQKSPRNRAEDVGNDDQPKFY